MERPWEASRASRAKQDAEAWRRSVLGWVVLGATGGAPGLYLLIWRPAGVTALEASVIATVGALAAPFTTYALVLAYEWFRAPSRLLKDARDELASRDRSPESLALNWLEGYRAPWGGPHSGLELFRAGASALAQRATALQVWTAMNERLCLEWQPSTLRIMGEFLTQASLLGLVAFDGQDSIGSAIRVDCYMITDVGRAIAVGADWPNGLAGTAPALRPG